MRISGDLIHYNIHDKVGRNLGKINFLIVGANICNNKQCAIITYKHCMYELPHELRNDLRLRKLPNIRKVSKRYRMIAYCLVYLSKLKFC